MAKNQPSLELSTHPFVCSGRGGVRLHGARVRRQGGRMSHIGLDVRR